ncbi:uncharacterized protein LOC141858702 isoform X2 [Brevipalpus obovatus]|uniref:uncharacterized protein LOC141858702 isoform X2 n=1 Tax=Brevipalpus obovatus TaxID=246614 RepID=UPI003D9F2A6A
MPDVKPCLARLKVEAGSSSRSQPRVNKSRQGSNQAKALKVKKEATASSSRQSSKPRGTSTRATKVKKETATSSTARRVKKERTATDSKPTTTRRKTYRRRRRRTVRRAPTTTRSDGDRGRGSRSPTNPRARISRTLGINSRNNRAHTLPEVRRLLSSDDDISARRAAAGITGLSLFGDELSDHGAVPPGEENLRSYDQRGSNFSSNQRSNVPTSSGFRSNDNELSRLNIPTSSSSNSRNNIPRGSKTETKSNISKVDLIGDIMNRQRILLADSRNVTINRDGTLQLNEQSERRSQNVASRSPSVNNNIRLPVSNQQENEPRGTSVPSSTTNTTSTTTVLPQSLPEAVRQQLISESAVTGIPLEDLIAELREMESLPFSIDMSQPMPALPIKRELSTQKNHASSSNMHSKYTSSPAKRRKTIKSEPEIDIICLD